MTQPGKRAVAAGGGTTGRPDDLEVIHLAVELWQRHPHLSNLNYYDVHSGLQGKRDCNALARRMLIDGTADAWRLNAMLAPTPARAREVENA